MSFEWRRWPHATPAGLHPTGFLYGGRCSAANWSEVAEKVLARSGDWDLVRGVLESYGVLVEPVTQADAEVAATLWLVGSGLSLADRVCLATGDRLDAVVFTADEAWGSSERVRQVR